eukprot:175116_1
MFTLLVVLSGICTYKSVAENNGVALTPPMGWLSWEKFRCATNCTMNPNGCINATLYETMGDILVSEGYADLGYTQVNIDDCWNTLARNSTTGEQMADPIRFPNGIKGVAEYIHKKGLKLGLYNDIGNHSCKGFSGIGGHYTLDANTFASWDIDMIKIDGCNASTELMYMTYPEFGNALNKTGRQIIYSCSWPAYVSDHGEANPPLDNTTLQNVAKACNLWRSWHDIQNKKGWDGLVVIVKHWKRDYSQYYNDSFLFVAGPGAWNDPDQLIIGDGGLTFPQEQTQMSLWAIFAAPLLMGNDLRTINNVSKSILMNKEVIDINQDALGKQGGYIWMNNNETNVVWMRELYNTPKEIAIVLQNAGNMTNSNISFKSYFVPTFVKGWNNETKYTVRDVINHQDLGVYTVDFTANIPPTSVGMYKLTMQ